MDNSVFRASSAASVSPWWCIRSSVALVVGAVKVLRICALTVACCTESVAVLVVAALETAPSRHWHHDLR